MSEPMVEQEETVTPPQVQIGDFLRQAREARGLSVDEIARTLKLGVKQLEALEASRWAALPGHTFIRGFVRNYARLVNVDPGPLMAQLDQQLEPPKSNLAVPETRPANLPYSGFDVSRKSRQMVLLGGGALLLAAAAYFLMPNDLSALRANAQSLLDSVGRKESESSVATSVAAEPALPPGQTLQQTLNPQAQTPVSAESEPAKAVEPTPTPAPKAETPVAPASQPAILTPPPSLQPSPVTQPAPIAPPAAVGGTPQIRVVADKMAWVEIRDRDNKAVFSQRMAAGVEQALSGQGPLSVVIGYAPGVRLFWHGQAIDLAPHTKGDVARLVLE